MASDAFIAGAGPSERGGATTGLWLTANAEKPYFCGMQMHAVTCVTLSLNCTCGIGAAGDAQEHPEKYPNLAVRVSGWSARFATLNKEMQEMIIVRTEQNKL